MDKVKTTRIALLSLGILFLVTVSGISFVNTFGDVVYFLKNITEYIYSDHTKMFVELFGIIIKMMCLGLILHWTLRIGLTLYVTCRR